VDLDGLKVVVRGVGDIGSAVAHRLFRDGCAVVIHGEAKPTTTRRGMAFADAVFDGRATLEGMDAVRAGDLPRVRELLAPRQAIPVYVRPLAPLLADLKPAVLVDARMRKHTAPEVQCGLAEFTVGLGPSLVPGRHADVVIETSWDGLGRVVTEGASLPLAGEPRDIGGHARDRYVYAPFDGVFRTKARIGEEVRQGQEVAEIGVTVLTAPLDGVLRGLTRDGVPVTTRTKVIDVDPRAAGAEVRGIGERPRRIADGVVAAIREWNRRPQSEGLSKRSSS
jgi:xanthine dehydrogenase accessory factor